MPPRKARSFAVELANGPTSPTEGETPAKVEKDPEQETPAKKRKAKTKAKESAPEPKKAKRDKSSPLPRSLTPRQLVPETTRRILKLVSVNVAGLRAVLRGDKAQVLQRLVEKELPDVLFLNEHKLKEEDVEEAAAQLKGLLPKEYSVLHWTCCTEKKGYSGVAMILRQAPDSQDKATVAIVSPGDLSVTRGMGKIQEDDPIIAAEGRVLTLELPELLVVGVYVPNSGADLQRLNYRVDRQADNCWDRALAEYVRHLREEKTKPVVVIGDMNCCCQVQDIWNMHDRPDFPGGLANKEVDEQYTGLKPLLKFAGVTPEERKSFTKMLADADLVDTFRALHPDATGVFSYFSQRAVQNRPMNQGLRLDYTLASSSLCKHLKPKEADAGDGQKDSTVELSLPRFHDSFVLDEEELIADHAAIGCQILLPPL